MNETRIIPCEACGGDGGFTEPVSMSPFSGRIREQVFECHACGGTGEVEVELQEIEMEDLTMREEIIEECAKVVEPKGPRPCDCERCDCGNHGDMAAVAAWDADAANARAIRALCAEAKDYDAMLTTGVIPESLRHRFKSA